MMRDDLVWIDAWLREWARWMRDDHNEIQRACGFPRKSAGFWSGGSGSADAFDHMVEAEDLKCIRTIDRAVRALGGQHYAALINHYVNVVAKHRGNPETLLMAAVEQVAAAAKKAGMTG
jgi:hypothetical protein